MCVLGCSCEVDKEICGAEGGGWGLATTKASYRFRGYPRCKNHVLFFDPDPFNSKTRC